MAKVEELQARRLLTQNKKQRYSEKQDKKRDQSVNEKEIRWLM